MKALLRELFPELVSNPVNIGDFCLINVLLYYQQTKFLLTSKEKYLSPSKFRPIIIIDTNNETAKFTATTTDIITRQNRPQVSIEDCEIFKPFEECNNLKLNRKNVWLFAKVTKSKKYRFFYQLDIYTLKNLQKEGKFKICGKCKENVINEIIYTIEKFGEYL